MATPFGESTQFAQLLERHRRAAGLSQEELAERAGMSRRGISDIERGLRHPHPGTARRLAKALCLVGQARLEFIGAAQSRRRRMLDGGSNLPIPLTSFVGRQRELTQVRDALQSARLFTLTGAGGVGKTRLALELARGVENEGDHRVCMVELAAIADSSAVAASTAAALGLAEQANRPPIETLKLLLRAQRLLLILDNCEHVLSGCAELAEILLGACPDLRILATSRERLGIVGETAWRVPSMTIRSDATRLFAERASALIPEFVLTEDVTPVVAHVCERLDGIPLAIELAAAQLPALSVQQLADRLDSALQLFVRGNRAASPRQQTLRATISWSYALLDPEEQLLFDRASVFAGGWTLEAAEHVCADPDASTGPARIERQHVLDLIARLVTKSLVIATPDRNATMRYRMLETLRQYGRERLVERLELDFANDRHADYFLLWSRRSMPPAETLSPLRDTSLELDNLRAALHWLIVKRDSHRLVQLGAALRWYWFQQGLLSEGARWYSEILALVDWSQETNESAHILSAAGLIAARAGKLADAEDLLTRASTLWRRLGNHLETARSLSQLGFFLRHTGRLDAARACFEEGVRLAGEHGFDLVEALNRLGVAETLYDLEEHDCALAEAGRPLELVEALEYPRAIAWASRAIGLIQYERGEIREARRLLEQSVIHARKNDGRGWWLADALACVAQLDVDEGQFSRAYELLTEALELSTALGDQRMVARCLERLAYLEAAQARYEPAIRLCAAADALRTATGLPRPPVESRKVERWLAPAEQALDAATREQVRQQGATLPLERVLTHAFGAAQPS